MSESVLLRISSRIPYACTHTLGYGTFIVVEGYKPVLNIKFKSSILQA